LSSEQATNARTIIAVGKGLNVPAQGWVVAIATAMQESGMRNLHYGDRDSLGMFQQRTAWGPAAQRMDAAGSSRMFYTGGAAGQRGLLDIHGWQSMPVARAAQAVQVSAFPSAYAKWETTARNAVAAFAGVTALTVAAPVTTCTTTINAVNASTGGGPTPAVFDTLGNPHTASQAVAWARSLAGSGQSVTPGLCAHYVALAYGRSHAFSILPSGGATALNLFALTPAKYKHSGASDTPPAGALVFWRTHNSAGHVALSMGGGYVASTDAPTAGKYSIVPISVIDSWGPRLGWTAPYFP
jgi:hypothetical protein